MGTSLRPTLTALLACLAVGATAVPAEGGQAAQVTQIASATTGIITGQVLDERGQPLADVVVSAVGGRTSFAVSDRAGRFTLRALPPGPYLVRAQLEGYVSARHSIVTVRPSARTVSTFTLRRVATSDEPRVMAAGNAEVALPEADVD